MKTPFKLKIVLFFSLYLFCNYIFPEISSAQTSVQFPQNKHVVYIKIMACPEESFTVNSLQMIVNDRMLTTLDKRIEERFFIIPGKDLKYLFKPSNPSEINASDGRIIEKNEFVIYRIETKKSINALNIIGSFGFSIKPGKIFIGSDASFIKDYFDLSDYMVFEQNAARLNCTINLLNSKITMDGANWKGTYFADRWGIPELWWYNMAKIISYNTEFENLDNKSTDFRLRARVKIEDEPGLIGVLVPWTVNPEAGYKHFFTLVSDSLPDYILINNKVVWNRNEGYSDNQGHISFTYVPLVTESVNISFIRKVTGKDEVLFDLNRSGYMNRLYVTRVKFKGEMPVYAVNPLPERTSFTGIDPLIACRQQKMFGEERIDYVSKALKIPQYAAQDMLIMPRQIVSLGKPDLYNYLKDCGIKGIVACGKSSKGSPVEKIEVFKNMGIKHLDFFVGTVKETDGNYYEVARHFTEVVGNIIIEEKIKSSVPGLANEWLTMVPDGTVSIHFQEINDIYGNWSKDIRQSKLAAIPKYSNINSASVHEAFRMHFQFLNDFINDIRSQIKPEFRSKVKILFLYDRACYNGAYAFQSGADILITKQIHRQNVNIVVANARGNALAYGKEYGFDCDTWDRCFYHSYHPDEEEQILKVYYHSGGKYLIDELSSTTRDGQGITTLGKTWFNFIKYANRHPLRGTQQVKIGIMRGFDEWNRVASQSASWESEHYTKEIIGQNYLTDFNLLNLVFNNYGKYDLTSTDRLCTGTPYGPADMIPWDAPADVMKKYKIIMLLGVNNLETNQLSNFREYVKNGGTLFIAAGHLKDEKRNYSVKDFTDLFGVKIMHENNFSGKPYTSVTVTGRDAQVLSKLENMDPLVIKNKLGKGRSYLFTGEFITEFGEDIPADLIKPELEIVKWITLTPASERIEYMVQKKGSLFILSLFNHGNVGFPSGTGLKSGPWTGSIKINAGTLNLKSNNIEAYKVIYNETDDDPFTLEKLTTEIDGNDIMIRTEVDRFSEIVIGPASAVQSGYFLK